MENGATVLLQDSPVIWLVLTILRYVESYYSRIFIIILLILHRFRNISYAHKLHSFLHHLANPCSNWSTKSSLNIQFINKLFLHPHYVLIWKMVVPFLSEIRNSTSWFCSTSSTRLITPYRVKTFIAHVKVRYPDAHHVLIRTVTCLWVCCCVRVAYFMLQQFAKTCACQQRVEVQCVYVYGMYVWIALGCRSGRELRSRAKSA